MRIVRAAVMRTETLFLHYSSDGRELQNFSKADVSVVKPVNRVNNETYRALPGRRWRQGPRNMTTRRLNPMRPQFRALQRKAKADNTRIKSCYLQGWIMCPLNSIGSSRRYPASMDRTAQSTSDLYWWNSVILPSH